MINPKVWVLGDSRTGNTNQAIALAQEIGATYELKMVTYNCFATLPNCLLGMQPVHVTRQLLQTLKREILPDIIITAGRRTALLACYLKQKSGNKLKSIQIMHPNLPYDKFDLVILPQHDNYHGKSQNILNIIGALNNVQLKLQIGGEELRRNYPKIGKFIAVIIGGNTKNYNFTHENASTLASILSQITKNHLTSLFVSFSRRTPNYAKQIIKKNLPSSTIIYDPLEPDKPNPYLSMLAEADYIINTADSISMCSEAASTGKPLYIFCPNNFKSYKHRVFIQQLVNSGIAKIVDELTTSLKTYSYTPLDEVTRITKFIKSRLILG